SQGLDAEHRKVRVERMNRLSNWAGEQRRVAGRANEQCELARIRKLELRPVDGWAAAFAHAVGKSLPHYADHRHERAFGTFLADVLPDRIAVRPGSPRKVLANDGDLFAF